MEVLVRLQLFTGRACWERRRQNRDAGGVVLVLAKRLDGRTRWRELAKPVQWQ
jgi:hypothetical protein